MKYSHFYLLFILVLAAFLRFFQLTYQSLWLDELYTVISTNPANTLASLIAYCKNDHVPGYFIGLYYFFAVFGYTEFSARLYAAIAGVLGVWVMYFLGKEAKSKEVGLVAAFITAINYFHIYYSQEVRFYVMLFLFTALSFLFYIKFLKNPKTLYFFLYILSTIALVYIHYFGILAIPVQGIIFIILLFTSRLEKKIILCGIASPFIIFFAFLPWLSVMISESKINSFWTVYPQPFFVFEYLYIYLGKDPFLALVYLFFLVLFIVNFKKISTDSEGWKTIPLLICVWILVAYLVPYLYSVIKVPILHERYTMMALPAWLLAFALGWSWIKNPLLQKFLLLAIFISTAVNFVFFNQYYSRIQKSQFREVAQAVIKENTKNYPIYSDLDYPYNFYFNQYQSKVKAVNPYYDAFEKDISRQKGVWVILAMHGHSSGLSPEQYTILNKYFKEKKRIDYHNASAILYE